MISFSFGVLLTLFLGVAKVYTDFLLFPTSSVLQITAAMAVPVILPGHSVYIDYGFQINFDLPSSPAQFFNAIIWPTHKERKRDVHVEKRNWSFMLRKYDHERSGNGLYHPHDFTAGELYQSMENTLIRFGYNKTCLLRSVCELARHPFPDGYANILTEALTFILTPSLHNAFAESDHVYREMYEEAENYGFSGADCANLYDKCEQDILNTLTKVLF